MMVSNLKGRLRLKSPLLKGEVLSTGIKGLLNSLKGIRQYQLNTRAGSLLIFYDPAIHSMDSLLKALRSVLPGIEKEGLKPSRELKVLNLTMLLSLAVAMLGALTGADPLHMFSGLLFLVFLGLHLYRYRKILLWR